MASWPDEAPSTFPDNRIREIAVAGFKSIVNEQSIEIKPLTILAGANNSGKSSILQPLLLLKQTLESPYNPGALLLHGPNVRFSSADQLLSRLDDGSSVKNFTIKITFRPNSSYTLRYGVDPGAGFKVENAKLDEPKHHYEFRPEMSHDEIFNELIRGCGSGHEGDCGWVDFKDWIEKRKKETLGIVQNRCFLDLVAFQKRHGIDLINRERTLEFAEVPLPGFSTSVLRNEIVRIIHLPGLRGGPERTYPFTSSVPPYSGTFEKYTASIIASWQTAEMVERSDELGRSLNALGLTWCASAKRLNDSELKLQVGRTPSRRYDQEDLIDIADVGLGVSQTLPVLVALQVAKPGQIVYIEQPEIHLHPKAQTILASILVSAANRGVRVIAETHSSLLLLGIQTLVAEGRISPEIVKLHWFTRNEEGETVITRADLDETGSFGDWPEDFADTLLTAESRYLDAAESHRITK